MERNFRLSSLTVNERVSRQDNLPEARGRSEYPYVIIVAYENPPIYPRSPQGSCPTEYILAPGATYHSALTSCGAATRAQHDLLLPKLWRPRVRPHVEVAVFGCCRSVRLLLTVRGWVMGLRTIQALSTFAGFWPWATQSVTTVRPAAADIRGLVTDERLMGVFYNSTESQEGREPTRRSSGL